MDYDLIRYAALILFIILVYAVLARGLFNATEPRRQEALDIVEELYHSAQVSDRQKKFVYDRIGELHSGWQAWKLVFSLLRATVRITFTNVQETTERVDSGIPQHLRPSYERLKVCWVIGILGNSPLALFVFAPLALTLIAFFTTLSAMSKLLFSANLESNNHTKAIT